MKRMLVRSFYAAMILSLIVGATARAGGRPLSRKEFAEKMAQVKEGMPEAEVRALLGTPDDVRTCDELRGTTARTRSIWCYGTNGHLTYLTPGSVYVGPNDKAQHTL